MHRYLSAALVLAVSWVITPDAAEAQERQGFWGGLGGGWGSAGVSCDECDGDREGSGTGYFRVGWTLNDQTLIGAEFNLWSKKAEIERGVDTTVNLYNFAGTVTFYPQAASGFFVKGGGGVAYVDTEVSFPGSKLTADGSGLGLIVGAGYDVRVARIVSITPAVNYWYGKPGDLKDAGSPLFRDFSHNVIELTLGVTFH